MVVPGPPAGSRRGLIDVALGTAPADVYVGGGRVVDVCTGAIYEADVAIAGGRIAAVGEVDYARGPDTRIIEARGKHLVPGLVDTHSHSFHGYAGIDEYVRAMLSHGVTAVADDLYALGIVGGLDALAFFKEAYARSPLRLIFLVPTLAFLQNRYIGLTPTGGVSAEELFTMLEWDDCRGVSETPFPPVVQKYPEILDLFDAALARGQVITGHAPDIEPRELQAYAAMGVHTDHESVDREDAVAKARAGMKILIREGSIGHDAAELFRVLIEDDVDPRCLSYSTDVSSIDRLASTGGVDEHVRMAIAAGVSPVAAIQMATINGAEALGLHHDIGSITPGRRADILLVDDLSALAIDAVMVDGEYVVEDGEYVVEAERTVYPPEFHGTVTYAAPLTADDLVIAADDDSEVEVRAIAVKDGTVLTDERRSTIRPVDGNLPSDMANDVLHLAMVDRHGKGTGIGLGFVHGFGLEAGAIASSVSCECCNVGAAGTNGEDMAVAINWIAEKGGGMVVVRDGEVLAGVELPILGMLSEDPLDVVVAKFDKTYAAISALGCELPSPWSQLEFCFAGGLDGVLKLSDEGLLSVIGRDVRRVGVVVGDDETADMAEASA